MSRVTIVRQAILMWGARAACSGAVDYLRRCAPPVDTAPLRSLAPCLPDRVVSKQPHSKEGVCPRARAPLPLRLACLIAPVQRDRAPHAHRMTCSACPTPSRKPHPLWGGLAARIMCGCGRARRARLRGLRGLRCQRCAQTGRTRRCAARATGCRQCIADRCDYAACVWLCPPPGAPAPVWRLRCAWPTGAWPHAHRISAIVLGAGLRGLRWERAAARNDERAAHAALQLYRPIDVSLDSLRARRC